MPAVVNVQLEKLPHGLVSGGQPRAGAVSTWRENPCGLGIRLNRRHAHLSDDQEALKVTCIHQDDLEQSGFNNDLRRFTHNYIAGPSWLHPRSVDRHLLRKDIQCLSQRSHRITVRTAA